MYPGEAVVVQAPAPEARALMGSKNSTESENNMSPTGKFCICFFMIFSFLAYYYKSILHTRAYSLYSPS